MRVLLILAAMAFFGFLNCVRADKPAPPLSHKTVSANGKYVFVMISPLPKLDASVAESKAIRAKYAKSGLYKNDGSVEPLWTVDWYRYKVDVASDGEHVVRHGNWPEREGGFENPSVSKEELKQEAVSFFAKGKLLRQYSIVELIDEPKNLKVSVSHFEWRKNSQYSDDKRQFEVVTQDGNRILFDVTTAKIIEKKKAD